MLPRKSLYAMVPVVLTLACGNPPTDPDGLYRKALDLWFSDMFPERHFVLRIDGLETYAPCTRPPAGANRPLSIGCRGAPKLTSESVKRWRRLFTKLRELPTDEISASTLHTRALAKLRLSQESGALLSAQQDLEAAIDIAEDPSPMMNDLAIVLRLRADAENHPRWIIHALDWALAAKELGHTPSRAFNAGELLAESHLRFQAEEAWKAALDLDELSPWSAEIRSSLIQLGMKHHCELEAEVLRSCLETPCRAKDLTTRCYEVSLAFGRDQLLPSWAEAVVSGQSERAGTLWATIGELRRALDDQHGSGALQRLIAEFSRAPQTAAAALRAYGRGRTAVHNADLDQAEHRLREAHRLAASKFPTLALLIDLDLVRAAYGRAGDYSRVGELVDKLEQRTRESDLFWIRGQIARFRGLFEGSRGYSDASRASFSEAIKFFETSGSELSTGYLLAQLAESDFFSGNRDRGWSLWYRGMAGAGAALRPRVGFNFLDIAALELEDERLEHAGLAVTAEEVRLGNRISAPNYAPQAHLRYGSALAERVRKTEALEELRLAERKASQIKALELRERVLSDIALLKVKLTPGAELPRSIRLLSDTLELHRRTGLRVFLPTIFHARAEAYRHLGDWERARSDLEAAVTEVEYLMTQTVPNAHFLDRRQEIFDSLVEIELITGTDPTGGLMAAERSRLGAATRGDLDVSRVMSQLAPGTCLLYFKVLPDRLITWVKDGHDLDLISQTIDHRELRALTRGLTDSLVNGNTVAFESTASRLYDLLVRQAESCLQNANSLVFAPDSFLYAVPFALLRNRATQRYLVEETPYRLIPGLAWLGSKQHVGTREEISSRTAVLASPQPSQYRFPSLEELSYAESEAAQIVALYPGSNLVESNDLYHETLAPVLESAVLFHFAGHSVTDFLVPSRSALLIGTSDDAISTASDLRGLALPGLGLAFLSSCQAMNGPISSSSGPVSLARALLDAGTGGVVASVTDVDDAQTAELSVAFHRRLADGWPASHALRAAQLDLLRRSRVPNPAWAGYSLLGNEVVFGKVSDWSVSKMRSQ